MMSARVAACAWSREEEAADGERGGIGTTSVTDTADAGGARRAITSPSEGCVSHPLLRQGRGAGRSAWPGRSKPS